MAPGLAYLISIAKYTSHATSFPHAMQKTLRSKSSILANGG